MDSDMILEFAEMAAIRREIGRSACASFRIQLREFSYGTIGRCMKLKVERSLVFPPRQIADMLEEHGFIDGRYYDRDTLVSLLDSFLQKHGWREEMATVRADIELPGLGIYATPYSFDILDELRMWYQYESGYTPPFVTNGGAALYLVDDKELLTERELFAFDIPKNRAQPFAAVVETRRCDGCDPSYRTVLPENMSAVVESLQKGRANERKPSKSKHKISRLQFR